MKDKFKALISIVLYNPKEEELKKQIEILRKLDINDIKICFLDNSTKQKYFIEDISAKLNLNFEYIFLNKNIGFGAGHNFIFNKYKKLYNFDYFFILNPDIEFDSNIIDKIVKRMDIDKSIGLSSVKILNSDRSIQYNHRKFPKIIDLFLRILIFIIECFYSFFTRNKKTNFAKNIIEKVEMRNFYKSGESYFEAEMISGCFMCFRVSIFCSLKGFDDRYFMYYEDLDISKRASNLARNIVFTDIFVIHKWSRGSTKNLNLLKIHLNSIFRYFILNPFLKIIK